MDLAAYGLVQEDAPVTTAEARQAYLNTVIGKLAAADVNTATAAKSVIILKALGVDPQKLTTADGKALDAVAILKNLPASQDVYTAPY